MTDRRDTSAEAVLPEKDWPYGPPEAHQECCSLKSGGTFCDCIASDESEDDDEPAD